MANECKYTAQDFKAGQPRWCPGCGDHALLAALHKAMAEIGVAPHNTAVISGIGCSSVKTNWKNMFILLFAREKKTNSIILC